MTKFFEENKCFILAYGALFIFFFWPLILLQKTFIVGDYRVQMYPWLFHYAQTLKGGHFPYLTDLIACGFPLAAEGQIAGYYLFHLAAFFVLPFEAAYTWSLPIHYLFGALGVYLYARKSGLSTEAGALAAMVFTFSSMHGGSFYALGTLRTLSWLPWCLWLVEGRRKGEYSTRKLLWVSVFGLFISQMWTAGFPQLALYALGYLFLFILFAGGAQRWRLLASFVTANLIGVVLALPQLMATFELIGQSARSGESAAFALWGSVPPPAFASLLFPEWGALLRATIYIGMLPLLLCLLVFFTKKDAREKTHARLAGIFLFLSLGKFIPGYPALLDALSLTSMRNPSKFLFFAAFSLTFLAAAGWDRLRTAEAAKIKKTAAFFFVAVLAVFLAAAAAYHLGEPSFKEYGHRYAEGIFSQKADPMNGPEYYHRLMDQILERAGRTFGFANPWSWLAVLLAAASALGVRAKPGGPVKVFLFFILIVDLAVFSAYFGTGFMGNAGDFPKEPAAVRKLRELAGPAPRIAEWSSGKELLPPNSNMTYGVAHAGGYSPLLLKRYYELTKGLGLSDASLGRFPFSKEAWAKGRRLFDLLGAEWIVSDAPLSFDGLGLAGESGGRFIYRNDAAQPVLSASYEWVTLENKAERLDYLTGGVFPLPVVEERRSFKRYEGRPEVTVLKEIPGSVSAKVSAAAPALVILRKAFYSRWKASVDGKKQKIIPVDHAFMGIFVEPGDHEVRFFFDKTPYRQAEAAALAAVFSLIAANLVFSRRRK